MQRGGFLAPLLVTAGKAILGSLFGNGIKKKRKTRRRRRQCKKLQTKNCRKKL